MIAGLGTDDRRAAQGSARHVPVLLDEVLQALAPRDGEAILDGTFGAGGYSAAILDADPGVRVIGVDRDPTAIAGGRELVERSRGRLTLVHDRFSRMQEIVAELGIGQVDGVVLDVGVSSMQLDEAHRGFSFRFDGPLDMRMGPDGLSAGELVNSFAEKDLAALLRTLGEERRASAIARAIAETRAKAPIATTRELAKIVEGVLGPARDGIHPATRTFQALRIAVNDELGELARALVAAEEILAPGGRLVVVSFHSLEDRIVKTFLADRTRTRAGGSRHLPEQDVPPATFETIVKGALVPSDREASANPRARSAKLRAARRTEAEARDGDPFAYGVPHLPSLDRLGGLA